LSDGGLDQVEKPSSSRLDVRAVLNVVGRSEPLRGRVVAFAEQSIECFQHDRLVLFRTKTMPLTLSRFDPPSRESSLCDPARTIRRQKNNYIRHVVGPADSFQRLHSKRECAPSLGLRAMIESVDISLPWELLYLIDPVGIECNMPPDLLNSRKWILVRPHRVDGLLSSSWNAVVTAIAFVRTVGSVIRPF
jgi:hypothetical protein